MSSLATRSALTRLLARPISIVRTSPAADSMFGTSSTPGGAAASRRCTCSGVSTLDIISTSGRAMPARSSRPSPSSGLTRTAASAPALRQRVKAAPDRLRARLRSAGGVKSSSSSTMTSAPERAAASCAAGSAPGTKSQVRLTDSRAGCRAARRRERRDPRECRRACSRSRTGRGSRPCPARRRTCTSAPAPAAPGRPAPRPRASQLVLRVHALHFALELVQGADVGLGGSDDDVGVGADAVDNAAAARQAYGHLALRLGARGHRVNREEQQLGPARRDRLDRLERGVDRAIALRFGALLIAVRFQHDRRVRPLAHAAALAHGDEVPVIFGRAAGLLRHQRLQVLVVDLGLLVGKVLEALERGVHRVLALELDAELLQSLLECVAARELAEHDFVGAPADILGAHDLVGLARLEHAVLVDAGSMGEGVGADHRLVRLHHEAGDLRDEARGRHDLRRVDTDLEAEEILAGLERHHHFLERGVAGALAQAVDGAFDLARAAELDRGERVGYRHAEVIVAMDAPHRLVRVRYTLAQLADELAELLRHGVADRVRNVDGSGALLDHRFQHAAKEIDLRAAAVLRRELDVRAMLAREAYRELRLLVHLLRRHAQLLLHVQRARGDEGVDAPGPRVLQRIDAALDVAVVRAAQAAHHRVLHRAGDGAHRLEVAVGGGGEAGLDHVDAHALQRPRDAQLLLARHGGAGALLPVAHGGVEYDQTVFRQVGAHGMSPWPFWGPVTARIVGRSI